MNFKKNLLLISIILCILISLSAVSANEDIVDSVSLDANENDLSLGTISEDSLDEEDSNELISSGSDFSLDLSSNENEMNDVGMDNNGNDAIGLDGNSNENPIISQQVDSNGNDESAEVLGAENSDNANAVNTSLTVSSKNVYKDKNFTIKVYVNGLSESVGSVQIYRNGKYLASKNVENGVATFSFRATTLGKTTFYVYFTGGNSSDGTYYSSSYSDERTVTIKAKANITVSNYFSHYKSDKKFTVKVKNLATGKGDRYAKIIINIYKNKKRVYSKTVTADVNGVYKGKINLGVGTYKMLVKMASEHYTYEKASASVNVHKAWVKIKARKHSCWEGRKILLSAVVRDHKKRLLNVGTVKFTVNGKTYKVKVKNGKASQYVKLPVGTYKYKAKYINKNYFTKKDSSKVIVKKNFDTQIIASNKVFKAPKYRTYKVTLKTKAGKAIKSTRLSLKIGKNTFKAKTNKKGVATFKILYSKIKKSERSKNYKVTLKIIKNKKVKVLKNNRISLKVDGKIYSRKTTKNGYATFKVKKPAAIRKYYVSLRTTENLAVPKASLTLKVKKKTFKATTNAKGNAVFKINNLNKNAKSKAAISFGGMYKYNKSTKTTYITIKDR